MAISRKKKEQLVKGYVEQLSESSAIIITDYRGLTVPELQQLRAKIREAEKDPESYRQSSSGYLAEIDRMNLEVREYLSIFPGEIKESA